MYSEEWKVRFAYLCRPLMGRFQTLDLTREIRLPAFVSSCAEEAEGSAPYDPRRAN